MTKKESKKVFEHTFDTLIKAEDFDAKEFMTDEHTQDCYENVYVDFEEASLVKSMVDDLRVITKMEIRTAPED
jgi:hypothetical protein